MTQMHFGLIAVTLIITLGMITVATDEKHKALVQGQKSDAFLTYENETANMKIQYPSSWFAETKNVVWPNILRIFPQEFMAERYPPVSLEIGIFDKTTAANPMVNTNLSGLAQDSLDIIEARPDFRLINFTENANLTLFNGTITVPAFEAYVYDFSRLLVDFQEMSLFIILNDKYVVTFTYDAETESFDKYLPEVRKMIDSFQLLSGNNTVT